MKPPSPTQSTVGRLGRAIGMRAGHVPEWTVEANPESFTAEVAQAWAEAGVNRISLGAQTFSHEALKWMGRLHTPDQVKVAVDRARNAGISNVSVDLIFGLPDSVPRSWSDDLHRVSTLGVQHVSLYGLTVEGGTPLDLKVNEARVPMPSESRYRSEFLEASVVMTAAGFVHYEVSNFARPGNASVHNRAYWRRVPYVGLGNGAHRFVDGRRWWNHRSWPEYASAVEAGRSPRENEEVPTGPQTRLEKLWLELREAGGTPVPRNDAGVADLVEEWASRGLACVEESHVRLTADGWLLLDSLVVELDQVMAEKPVRR